MSKRYTQAERAIYALVNGRTFVNKRKGLEVIHDEVLYNGTKVGYILENENHDYCYDAYEDYIPLTTLVLTLQDSMLPERARRALVLEANKNEMLVVFKPLIDIGFGLPEGKLLTAKEIKKTLTKVAKYSQDDIKTAASVSTGYYGVWYTQYNPGLYTCNQILEGHSDKFHAEQILVDCINMSADNEALFWLMDLEPCEECLHNMIDCNTKSISYITPHKDKWNTPEYIQLVNDIHIKKVRNKHGFPITYQKEEL